MTKKNFYRKKLKNGMTLLFEKRDIPVTTVCFATKYGSAYESIEQKGIAHFIEHMVFKGTRKRTAEQIAAELEKIGGELNAFTSDEFTGFHVKLPSRYLNKGIDVLSDIFFSPLIDEQEMEKERKVILEEMKIYHDDPQKYVFDKIRELSYKKPFGISPIGTVETLSKMHRQHLVKEHSRNYTPSNTILCVVGNNEIDEIVRLAEKLKVKNIEVENKVKPERINEKCIEKRKGIHQSNLMLSLPSVKATDKLRYAVQAFATILGEGMSSKLFKEIREKRGLAYAVKSFFDCGRDYGNVLFYVGTEKGKEEEVKELVIKEIRKMKDLPEKEMKEVKEQLIGSYETAQEDSRNVCFNLILDEICGGAEEYYMFVENIKKIRLDEIRNLADFKDYSYIALVPE